MIKLILDSCIWSGAKNELESAGYDCKWVGDLHKDLGDMEIMILANEEKRIIITLDKDFGELAIFRGVPHYGIIRLVNFSATQHGSIALLTVKNYENDLAKKAIITVDSSKVRIRLPGN